MSTTQVVYFKFMSIVRKDFIERMIEQLARALAALLNLRKKKDLVAAMHLICETTVSLLGLEYSTLTALDSKSIARLLAHPEKVKALAKLISEEAAILEMQGEISKAAAKLLQAADLIMETSRTQSGEDPECATLLSDYQQRVAELRARSPA